MQKIVDLEREENVKSDVFIAYITLLQQTKLVTSRSTEDDLSHSEGQVIYCIGRMHLSIHYAIALERCILPIHYTIVLDRCILPIH